MSSGPKIFDRRLLRVRRRRARALGPATFLLDHAATELAERLSAVLRQFDIAVDLGASSDAVPCAGRERKNQDVIQPASTTASTNLSCVLGPMKRRCRLPIPRSSCRIGTQSAIRQ